MTLVTAFTRMLGVQHPIVLAPMGDTAGGALAAAVSNGGGLGLLGGGQGDLDWLDRELPIAAEGTSRPWGVGFQSWAVTARTVRHALAMRPAAVMLSFGDPRELAVPVRDAGALLIIQVTDMTEARQALAAALALGAAGALIGTRFQATAEGLADPAAKAAIIAGSGEETERSTLLDIARSSAWPSRYPARTLGHPYLDRWRGREEELAADPEARRDYQDGVARGDLPPRPVWASQAIDLIRDLPPAADLVAALAAEAEDTLTAALYPGDRTG